MIALFKQELERLAEICTVTERGVFRSEICRLSRATLEIGLYQLGNPYKGAHGSNQPNFQRLLGVWRVGESCQWPSR